jgi:integrase
VAGLLRFAVTKCGAADRWLPPADLEELVGLREISTTDTTPIKPDQLERLLEGIRQPSLRLAVALVGLFGLRPAELDLTGLPGEGARVLAQLESGLIPLPTGIRNARDLKACGAAFRQYLDRCPAWQQLLQEAPGLSPYALRHGYALRAHTTFRLSIRTAAALMGHDPITHQRHYGAWTDEATIEAELERALATATGSGC